MNKVKLIKKTFGFLENEGYTLSVVKTNIEYCFVYSNSGKQIIVNYDLRQHYFDVGIQYIANSSDPTVYLPLLETDIADTKQKEELLNKLKNLYREAEADRTISKKHFCEIINAYANFIKGGIDKK